MTKENNKQNLLFGSYRSFTGEPADGLLSIILTPFKKHQTKNLIEQYESGVRLFDFHVKWNKKFKKFYPSDGYWSSGRTLLQTFGELNTRVAKDNEKVYYILTLDNPLDMTDTSSTDYLDIIGKFNSLSNSLNSFYKNIDLIEKRITKKRSLKEIFKHEPKEVVLWKDEDNADIKYDYNILKCPLPICSYWFNKYIIGKNNNISENNNNIYIIKDFC